MIEPQENDFAINKCFKWRAIFTYFIYILNGFDLYENHKTSCLQLL